MAPALTTLGVEGAEDGGDVAAGERLLNGAARGGLNDGDVAGGEVTGALRHEGAVLEPLFRRSDDGSILGPAPTTIRSAGTRRLAAG